ncbi:MAG: orotate phosphoribosyltransferase [Candidatus Helarchaeota archaeon]
MDLSSWKEELIKFSIQRQGLIFGEFTLKSGRRSPYFFNLANLINDGIGLQKISEAYAHSIKESFGLAFDYLHGPAYKGIPLAAAIAIALYQKYAANKRWGFDRKELKTHGVTAESWLVGNLKDNDRIILVDDVITTGLTKIKNIEKVEKYSAKSNLKFEAIFIFLDRQETDTKGNNPISFLEQKGVKVHSILKIRDVVEYLKDGYLSSEQYHLFQNYISQYGT